MVVLTARDVARPRDGRAGGRPAGGPCCVPHGGGGGGNGQNVARARAARAGRGGGAPPRRGGIRHGGREKQGRGLAAPDFVLKIWAGPPDKDY